MKIQKLLMEDWLADYQLVEYNLAESGFIDFTVGEFMKRCGVSLESLAPIHADNVWI